MKIFGRYEAASSQAAISLAGGGWLVVAGGWWWCRLLMRARVIIGRRVGRRGGACALAPALSCVNCCRAGAGQPPMLMASRLSWSLAEWGRLRWGLGCL